MPPDAGPLNSSRRTDGPPAIAYTVVYAIALFIVAWRLISRKHRDLLLLYVLALIMIRVGTLAYRAYTSYQLEFEEYGKSYSGLFSFFGLESYAFAFLFEPTIKLFKRFLVIRLDNDGILRKRFDTQFVLYLVEGFGIVALIISLVIAVLVNFDTSPILSLSQEQMIKVVYALRLTGPCVCVMLIAAVGIGVVWMMSTMMRYEIADKRGLFPLGEGFLLSYTFVYKVCFALERYGNNSWWQQRTVLWVFGVGPEMVATCLFLVPSLPKWYGDAKGDNPLPLWSGRDVEDGDIALNPLGQSPLDPSAETVSPAHVLDPPRIVDGSEDTPTLIMHRARTI